MNASDARARFDAMCADGTFAHSADEWRTMAALLTEAAAPFAAIGADELVKILIDRADECIARASRSRALRSREQGERTWLDILRDSGAMS